MNETENKLLELANKIKAENKSPEPTCVESELVEETTIDDIEDLVTKNFDRVLTNKDYLILVGLDTKGIDSVASEHGVSVNYIKKLMRSSVGNEFLKAQAKMKTEQALSISSLTVANGVLEYQKMIAGLFEKQETALALSYLFGRSSMLDVMESLNKQQQGVVEDDSQQMRSLFSSLLSDNVKGK